MKILQKSLLVALVLVSLVPVQAFAFSGSGSGTSLDPYEITTCDQFIEINNALTASYELANDIDCSSQGIFTDAVITGTFTGHLQGNLHSISNVTINTISDDVGLFSQINTATIENLIISNTVISGAGSRAGILVGNGSSSTFSNVSTSGSLSGTTELGGLIGRISGATIVDKCSSSAQIVASGPYVGGLIGYNYFDSLTLTDSFATGSVTGSGLIGGLIGGAYDSGTSISNCYASGEVTAITSNGFVGGLVGQAFATISNSFATGEVTVPGGSHIGGLIGENATSTLTSNFYDISRSNQSNCSDGGSVAGCTGVNASNSASDYFFANNSNPPLSSWDFSTTWATVVGGLPVLRVFVPTPTPTVTNTSTSTPVPPTATATSTPTSTITPIASNTPAAVPTSSPLPTATPIGTLDKEVKKPSVVSKRGSSVIQIRIKDSSKGNRNYYVAIINTTTEKLYKRVRVKIFRGIGKVKLNNVPAGTYRAYTIVTKDRKYHSRDSMLVTVQ